METALFTGLVVIPKPGHFSRWDCSVAGALLLPGSPDTRGPREWQTTTEPWAALEPQAGGRQQRPAGLCGAAKPKELFPFLSQSVGAAVKTEKWSFLYMQNILWWDFILTIINPFFSLAFTIPVSRLLIIGMWEHSTQCRFMCLLMVDGIPLGRGNNEHLQLYTLLLLPDIDLGLQGCFHKMFVCLFCLMKGGYLRQ